METSQRASRAEEKFFSLTWYHREEFQFIAILAGVVVFFSREWWVLDSLAGFLAVTYGGLYGVRVLEQYLKYKKKAMRAVATYTTLKHALHGHPVERSRILISVVASVVLGLLCLHRMDLADSYDAYNTPTDIYWILVLGWYFWLCCIAGIYLFWLWRNWAHQQVQRIPFFDGLVASLCFFHGLSQKNKIVTFAATFFLGGIPSYYAYRINPANQYGYVIAVGLIVPVILLTLGGAFYAMKCNREREMDSVLSDE